MSRRRIYADSSAAAEANRRQAAERSRERGRQGKEIGPLPEPESFERRESCRYDLKKFLEIYFPKIFKNPWSGAHLALIKNLQNGILNGESSVTILPRGFGKTSVCICSALWAALYGHKSYILLIAASAQAAKRLLQNVRNELMFNEMLAAPCGADTEADSYKVGGDFPEACVPYRRIGSAAQRQGGQTCNGELTRCLLSSDRLILPTVKGSPCSGCVIEAAGLTSNIRGKNVSTSRGNLRPDMLICDDLQSDKLAKNPRRVDETMELLNGTLRGLSGVDKPLTTVVTLTCIAQDDMAERLIKSPVWRTVKYGVLDRLPSDSALEKWAQINQIRADAISEGLTDKEVSKRVNEAFEAEKEELLDGCQITWDSFKEPDDCHAMIKIMRLFYDDYSSFMKEYMNCPEATSADNNQLTLEQLKSKVTAYKRGQISLEVEALTLGCDSQNLGLFWVLMGHCEDGSSMIIDFGKFPRSMKKTLTQQYDGLPLDSAIYNGYRDLLSDLLSRTYTRPDGLEVQIGRCLLDCSHGPTSLRIQQFIRDFNDPRITPIFGRAKDPNELVFGKRKAGELRGTGWAMPPVRKIKGSDGKYVALPRHAVIDVNSWKTALRTGLQARQGVPGSITIFHEAEANLKEFFNHLLSERSSTLSGRYGSVDSWKLLPNRMNHWWDCCVYSLCAGNMIHKLGGGYGRNFPKLDAQFNSRKRVRLSEIQAKRGGY